MRRYGWRPDAPDDRDFLYSKVHAPKAAPQLPPRVSLRDKMPTPFDQGELGSCTANALCGALAFLHNTPPNGFFIGSRLQVYYGERSIEHTIKQDAGAQIRDGVKVLANTGAAPEADWPYDITKFAEKPPAAAVKDAHQHKIASYSRLVTEDDFRTCLADGFPFVVGFTVYASFESEAVAKNGIVPMPKRGEQQVGGHAVCVIGYDRQGPNGDCYEIQNSWGPGWGDNGRFWMPAAYLDNAGLASDAWTLRS